MRNRSLGATALALALVSTSCSDRGAVAPGIEVLPRAAAIVGPAVRISEIHYDNSGTDVGEAIEISGPAGTDLTGWKVVLYNGNGGATYEPTTTLSGTIPATCGARGVKVVSYASNGIQNGAPDGVALVNAAGQVIEFLSYEGVMTAVGGAANGMTSTDIGVLETGSEAAGLSLQRSGDNVWSEPAASTFGACNTGEGGGGSATVASVSVSPASAVVVTGSQRALLATAYDASNLPIADATLAWASSDPSVATVSASGVVTALQAGTVQVTATAANQVSGTATVQVIAASAVADVRLSELHYDNAGTDAEEAVEVSAPTGTSLAGWTVVLHNGSNGAPYDTLPLAGSVVGSCTGGRGVAAVAALGMQNGSPDGVALVSPQGVVVEFLSYEGTFTASGGAAAGIASTDIGVEEGSTTPAGSSLQRNSEGTWYAGGSSFGACNAETAQPVVPIRFSGRDGSDPALPVGFEDQLFASLVIDGSTVPTTFTWSSETPAVASVDQDGVVRALAAGTAVIRATATDGATRTYLLATAVATPGGTAQYANNVEFGVPADGTPADDQVIATRAQYVTSWNAARGIPNWVSYEMDASHFGSQDRCDCFTYDPELPAGGRYTTADYTGAGSYHGFGIDRGHLARSADRTTGTLDNARTFYFSNIVPQASDNNQGPWSRLETYLGDLARSGTKEVYVIAGASGGTRTVKDEGRITIPDWVWKVAVVMPRDRGLADVRGVDDLEVIAVIMPNKAGIRDSSWQTYATTVDAVERLSGYDLLDRLRDDLETAMESGTSEAITLVQALQSAGTLNAGQTNSLLTKLRAALRFDQQNDWQQAANVLRAILHELDDLVATGELTGAEAAPLRRQVEFMLKSGT